MRFEIDTTELNREERNELAKMLFKCGYGIKLVKTKEGSKNGCVGCMWDKVHCNERNYAEEIYNADYRKASDLETEIADLKAIAEQYQKQFEEARTDVAREIFEEMQARFKELYEEGKKAPFQCLVIAFNETEKKYTESEKENG